jgi:hypothetical protein
MSKKMAMKPSVTHPIQVAKSHHRCCEHGDLTSPIRRIVLLPRREMIRIGRSLWSPRTSNAPLSR